MAAAPRFTKLVESLPGTVPFVGPETLERRRDEAFRIRVGANESAFGVSPKAAGAMRAAIGTVAWYNDPEGRELRSAIAARHGVGVEEVLLGAGIDEMPRPVHSSSGRNLSRSLQSRSWVNPA